MIRQFLPGEFHGQRSLVGYSPCGYKESDMTEWLSPLQFISVQLLSHVQHFATPCGLHVGPHVGPHVPLCRTPVFPVHHKLPELTQTHVHRVSDAIQPSHPTFSSCPQSFPASGSFPVNQFFASGGQSIGVSTSASVLPMNIEDWFPLGLTDLISLLSKGLSRDFSNTTVQKHQFFGAQLSLWSNSHIHTWLHTKP